MSSPSPGSAVPPPEAVVRRMVGRVLATLLERRRATGVVVAGPPGPEATLLERWVREERIEVHRVEAGRARAVAEALAPDGPDVQSRVQAWRAAAHHLSRDRRLLPLGTATRTHLLLEGSGDDVLPLGDLPASWVHRWQGDVSPVELGGVEIRAGDPLLGALDGALAAFLDRGHGLAEATAALPPGLARDLARILREGTPGRRAPVIPKVGAWTAGLDLAL